MAGRPSSRMHHESPEAEINLIPMMNVFCILIPFLILSAVFVQLAVIDTSLPTALNQAPSLDEKPPEKPKLTLTVALTEEGFTIAGYGGVLDVGGSDQPVAEGAEAREPEYIIRKVMKDGKLEYDYVKLQLNLVKIKDKFPEHYSIILLPGDDVIYQEIITTMDVSREKREVDESTQKSTTRILFPSPVIAGGLR